MKGRSYADTIRRLARWSDEGVPTEPPADEQRLVAAIEQALRARARRPVFVRRASLVGVAAAASIALAAGGLRWRRGVAPTVVDGVAKASNPRALSILGADDAGGIAFVEGARVPLTVGMAIGAGATVRAPTGGEVRVGTAEGTSINLEAGGELTVAEAGVTQRFALRSGAVVAHVSHQITGERFIVDTRDAEVEVRGTMFRVAVVPADASCGDGATTRVSVLEGVVLVRAAGREVSVTAGGAWPVGCNGPVARVEPSGIRAHAHGVHGRGGVHEHESSPPTPASPTATPPAPVEATPVARVEAAAPPAPTSSLAAENDLFASAVRAKKQGHFDEAARLFAQLATAHPGSPLVESALVQRMKLLATIDPAAGARAAAAYLDRFPSGFARPEARALVARSSP